MNNQPSTSTDPSLPDKMGELADDVSVILNDMVSACVELAGADKEEAIRRAVKVTWSPDDDPGELAAMMVEQAQAAASEAYPVRSGAVYCFACNSAKCGHASPGTHGEVFMGYSNSGEPVWREFFSALNELGDDRVDTIFGDRPKPLARFISRKQLIADQLLGSGRNSMTYRIVCQVVAGYFDIAGTRCALTLHVVENPARDLFLQLLAPDSVLEVMTESPSQARTLGRLYTAIRDLRYSLEDLQIQWRTAKGQRDRQGALVRIERLMHHLVTVIERKGRQGQRRTQHAHERSQHNRPVHTAMKDLEKAGATDFYHDRPRKSVIVMGKRSRAHVFSPSGQHITTMQLPHEKLDRRVQRNRYAPMEPEEIQVFRSTVTPDEP